VHFVPPMVRRFVRAVWVTCFCALARFRLRFLIASSFATEQKLKTSASVLAAEDLDTATSLLYANDHWSVCW